tara:strand:- start:254 stop:574 length:321 start_codon:yes stop_codon:yes gene_type:complete
MRWQSLRLDTAPTFFQTVKIQRQLGHQMPQVCAFPLESRDLLASGVTVCVTTQTLLACFHEPFGPRVEVIGFVPFRTTQFIDCDLTMETFQDYEDLLFYGVFPACG